MRDKTLKNRKIFAAFGFGRTVLDALKSLAFHLSTRPPAPEDHPVQESNCRCRLGAGSISCFCFLPKILCLKDARENKPRSTTVSLWLHPGLAHTCAQGGLEKTNSNASFTSCLQADGVRTNSELRGARVLFLPRSPVPSQGSDKCSDFVSSFLLFHFYTEKTLPCKHIFSQQSEQSILPLGLSGHRGASF